MMSRCDFCDKSSTAGCCISHSHKKTKRTFLPNVHSKTINIDDRKIKVKVCTSCMKKLGK
ncbi:MAG: 50S ribosomal protein L28 [Candidatus Berkelbacteria bacterium]|nr:50S ribosomal protein L28 [Candidatus Berkelbacteria bacterium]